MDTKDDPGTSSLDKLLSPGQVADMLGVSERTLVRWAQNRTGPPFIQVGTDRNRRYNPADLKAWLDAQRVETA